MHAKMRETVKKTLMSIIYFKHFNKKTIQDVDMPEWYSPELSI